MDVTPELLHAARIALRMTRNELAQASGVGVRTIENFEAYRNASIETYLRIRKTLEEMGVRFIEAAEGQRAGFELPEQWISVGPDFISERQPRRDLRKPRSSNKSQQ
jgi:transcriptional regulator with XRE-family HTH domain